MNPTPFGFRVVGSVHEARRPVEHAVAFSAHALCDERAKLDSECYLSAFRFGDDFKEHHRLNKSERGFDGACWSDWLWFDIDRGEIATAQADAARLVGAILDRYRTLDDDDVLIFFSGKKGFHVGISTMAWNAEPSPRFHAISRRFAERVAGIAGVTIDVSVYSKLRLLRAPNSTHPAMGLHKRRMSFVELMHLKATAILDRAHEPEPFEIPLRIVLCPEAVADWNEATNAQSQATERRRDAGNEAPKLNALTLDYIKNSATEGERHRLLFSAAANLAEFDCPPALAHALLTEAGRDSGLCPSDVRRQIECGLAHVRQQREGDTR